MKKSQGRPYETSCNIFCNSFKLIRVYKSPKNIELYTIQGIICHTGVIRVINEPWKSTKDVLMRRPATHFATVLNWLVSTILPKTLNYIQYRRLCVTQVPYCTIRLITESWKKSQGRPNETSCNIFCNSFKLIGVFKSPKNIELYTIEGNICHPGAISRNKSYPWALKKSQGRPYETSCNIFCKSFKQIKAYISPKNIEVYTIQVLCVTQATIEVIAKSWKSPKDVLMRRPPTYFAKVLNRLKPTYLPRTLKYIQYRCYVSPRPHIAQ